MNTDRTQQRLNGQTSKTSVNDDTFLKIGLVNSERLLPPDEFNKTVNLTDRFDTERNRCTFYKILGTINPVCTNALFNLTDPTVLQDAYTWAGFNKIDFLDTSYPFDNDVADKTDYTYAKSLKANLIEKDGWFGFYDPDKTKAALCNFFDMEPKRERFSFIPDTQPFHPTSFQQDPNNNVEVKNWELTITYPCSADTTHNMVYGTTAGLLIVEAIPAIVANRAMTGFGLACKHNLKNGDSVRISGSTGYDGIHTVIRLGLDNGDLKDNYFVLDIPPTGVVDFDTRMSKVIDGIDSQYYFRIFKKIKTRYTPVIETDDYETYGLAFSENIYYDKITQFVFNEDIDVSDLTDNLNRPLSELYLTVVKTDSNNLFSRVSSGIDSPYIERLNESNTSQWAHLLNVPVINKIHNGASAPFQTHVPLELNVTINNNMFYGDLVEYNITELKETVLADVHHRFNTYNRESGPTIQAVSSLALQPQLDSITLGPRQEGYMYKAHHLLKIRTFSNYIESGDDKTEGIPNYAVKISDGRYLWRDLLSLGFDESGNSVNYPFLNKSHYLYNNYCFYVRRQDPFNLWNLFYTNYPSDPIGEKIKDKYIINSADNVC